MRHIWKSKSMPTPLVSRVTQWMGQLLKICPKPRKWWLGIIVSVYFLGVFSAVLRGNNVIHDVLDATRDNFLVQKCDQATFMAKAKLNTETVGALTWHAEPVTTVTTAILDNPVCFGNMVASMPKYPSHYEIEVYDDVTGKTVLRVVKE